MADENEEVRPCDLTETREEFYDDDVVIVDSLLHNTAKMPAKTSLPQNVLSGRIALPFIPSDKPNPTTTVAGQLYMYNGLLYEAKVSGYQGQWDASKFDEISIGSLLNEYCRVNRNEIFANWVNNISDLNDVVENSVTIVQRTNQTTTAHFPSDYVLGMAILCAYKAYFSGHYQVIQVLQKLSTGETWRRAYSSQTTSWSDWSAFKPAEKSDRTDLSIYTNSNQIFADWVNNISDLNDVAENSVTIVQRTEQTATAHFPSNYVSGLAILSTYKAYYSGHYQVQQVLQKLSTGETWRRAYSSQTTSWSDWISFKPATEKVFHVGSTYQYTTLRAGLAAAYATTNAIVYVHPGTYDLVTEFADSISDSMGSTGCVVGNGMKVVFYDGAKVKANFDFENGGYSDAEKSRIYSYFEPIRAGEGDFELVNLDIESTDCRYCVHDERGGSGTYSHKYTNCRMLRNTTYSDNGIIYNACIGGGLGEHGTIVIDGGRYQTITTEGIGSVMNGDLDFAQQPISYHNGNIASADSSITIKNVYFADKGYYKSGSYGASTNVTNAYISGCRMAYPPLVKPETATSQEDNMAVIEWQNEIVNDGEWSLSGNLATWIPAD